MNSFFGTTIPFLLWILVAAESLEIKGRHPGKSSSLTTLGTFNNKTFYTDLSVGLQYHANALDLCHVNGRKAALIETREENAFVAQFLETEVPDFQYFWIAASDLFHEGIWTSLKSGDELNYTNWNIPQTNTVATNCIYFTKSGVWVYTSCSADTNRPLCE